LLEGVAKYCPNLKSLRMEDVSGNPDLTKPDSIGLTDEGVAKFFELWKNNGNNGCDILDFHGCHSLQGDALMALIGHSHETLEQLNISGWKDVSAEALKQLGEQCKRLIELDVGWCRRLTDFSVKDILEGCPNVKLVKVWGESDLVVALKFDST
jgi:DNA repair protein RAD7